MKSEDLEPGVYYVVVSGDPGTYVVNVRLGGNRDHGPDFESSTLLRLHTPEELASVEPQVLLATSARIWPDTDDADVFRIDVDRTSAVTVRASGSVDTYATLYESDGTEITTNDNGTGNFRIESELDAGIYYVSVGGYNVGAYRVLGSAVSSGDQEQPPTPPPTTDPQPGPPAPTATALSATSIRATWEWDYTSGDSDVFELEVTPRGGQPRTFCRDFGGGASGRYTYRWSITNVAPETTYDVRYRYHPSGSCDSGTPDPWSGTASVRTPAESGGGSDEYCRDDDEIEPGGRCDIYDTNSYFEVESSGRGCLRGVGNICAGGGINWQTGSLTFIAERGSDDVWTIEDVEPEPPSGSTVDKSLL